MLGLMGLLFSFDEGFVTVAACVPPAAFVVANIFGEVDFH
jgi:hypothetical protein